MQLKECMEDTADNKVWGDWMLINLCVLCSVQYCCRSSSLLSWSWLSRPPLKGMTKAPGSWLSTHSLIFTSLVESVDTRNSSVRTRWTWMYLFSKSECIFMRTAEHGSVCRRKLSKVVTESDFMFLEKFFTSHQGTPAHTSVNVKIFQKQQQQGCKILIG